MDKFMDKFKSLLQKNEKMGKKPFYKKWWFIALILIIIIYIFNSINSKVNWDTLELGNYIPEVTTGKIEVGSTSDSYLSLDIKKISKKDYNEYKQKCIEMGYTIDSEDKDSSYTAFNSESYELHIYYSDYSKEYSITLSKPNKYEEFEWPENELTTLLPKPISNIGLIYNNTSNYFRIIIANTTIEEYNKYVSDCENNGFTIDYNKETKVYQAENSDGYEISLRYLGANNVDINIYAPKVEEIPEEKEESKEEKTEEILEQEEENKEPEEETKKESVYYSTNDKDTVKNGNSGVYAYRSRGGQYYNYYIIDFDKGYVYYFADGNGSESCDRLKITSGDLNNTLIITYHDGGSVWQEGLHFKYKRQPDHLIWEDSDHFEFDFYSTDLSEALKIRDKKTIIDY